MFFILDSNREGYDIQIFEPFYFDSRAGTCDWERGEQKFFNRAFVERHCKPVDGASAMTIQVLYGD